MIIHSNANFTRQRQFSHSCQFSVGSMRQNLPPPSLKYFRGNKYLKFDSFSAVESFNLLQSILRPNQFYIQALENQVENGFDIVMKHGYRLIFTLVKTSDKRTDVIQYKILYFERPNITTFTKEKFRYKRMDRVMKNIEYQMKNRLLRNIAPTPARKQAQYIQLSENMVFRLGKKLVMKVVGVYAFSGPAKDNLSDFYFCKKINALRGQNVYDFKMRIRPSSVCRICQQIGNSQSGSLMAGCCCGGSNEFVHASCLRQQMKDRFKCKVLPSKDNQLEVTICSFKNFTCDICGYELPKVFEQNYMLHNIIDIPIPKPPYILLCSQVFGSKYDIYILSRPKNVTLPLYLKQDDGYSAIFGRSSPADITIALSSISIKHAQIKFMESEQWTGNFYLQDLGSRFGTFTPTCDQFNAQSGDIYEYNGYYFRLD